MDKGLVFNVLLLNRVDTKNVLHLIYTNSAVVEPWKYSILFNLIQKNLDKKTCVLTVFKNLPIKRFWPEVNNRVNYPIKRILIEIDNNQIIHMEDEVVKYWISAFSCMDSSYGLRQLVSSWDMHLIAG